MIFLMGYPIPSNSPQNICIAATLNGLREFYLYLCVCVLECVCKIITFFKYFRNLRGGDTKELEGRNVEEMM